jgi:Leucine-rich repeat (LRR) protein/PKD repeat protein
MATRTVQINYLGKLFQFLSVSLFVMAVLAVVNLHNAVASAASSSPDSNLTNNIIPNQPNAPTAFCDDVTEIPLQECQTLEALYYSTGGDNWTNNTNWLVTNTPSDWYGVTVSSGNVSIIAFWNNNLTGSIPAELGNLTALQFLNLPISQLTGSIPTELGNLTALQGLNLSHNQLTGSIPPELGNLTVLEELNLTANQFTGSIPAELGNLTALYGLSLENNQLTGSIPAELGDLTALYGLNLVDNQLTGSIPAELGNLTALHYLNMAYNQLSGSIPTELGNLKSLQGLSLSNNQLTGSIPAELGNLTELYSLALYTNQLTGSIPAQLGNLMALQYLFLHDNQLTGSVPSELGNLTKLISLYLYSNQLIGSVPPELGNLTNLHYILIYQNQFTGSIPITFTNLSVLDYFYFYDTSLCEPTEQEYLDWQATILDYQGTGVSCEASFSCSSVTEIPQTECEALVALYNSTGGDSWTTNTNWLVTNTPSNWYGVSAEGGHVFVVSLNYNNLTGNLPPELGNLTTLVVLFLTNNHLTGSIPPELGNLTTLSDLNLYNNQLTGGIPPELGNSTRMQLLNLGFNQLTGSIPPELGNLTLLNPLNLYLDNNQLTGGIPPELGNLTTLRGLNLSQNQLSGSIPTELSNLTALEWLDLYSNQLTGSIPTELGNLTSLQRLSLRSNQLTGSIPLSFINLSNLDTFYFYDTFLCEPTEQEYLDWKATVLDYQGTGVSCVYDPPEANFSATPTTGSAPLTVSFTNTSTGTYISSAWDFGDGFTSTATNPTHTFYLAGAYTVSLNVSGDAGDDIETKTNYITVTVLAEEEVTSEEGGEISFSPAGGGTVSIQVPPGAVDETIILQVTSNPAVTVPPGSALVGVSFNLTAILDGLPLDSYEFLAPVTIRVDYTDEQVTDLDEDSLRLYFWDKDTETWLDAALTCDPTSTYTRNPDENWFSVDICHLTQFAVFGEIEAEDYSLFMPTLNK